jgi:small-conductance mechanosensitive channel/CRP-like cAMP-binding protein
VIAWALIAAILFAAQSSWGHAEIAARFPDYADTILRTISVALLVSLALTVDRVLRRVYWHGYLMRRRNRDTPKLIQDIVTTLLVIFAFSIGLWWKAGLTLTSLATVSGAAAVGIGFALQPVILDLFSGLSINFEGSYAIGDWLTVYSQDMDPPLYGRVSGITWRSTFLTLENGTRLMIPNHLATSNPVLNHSRPPAPKQMSVEVSVDVRVPADRVIDMLLGEAFKATRQPGLVRSPEPDVLLKTVTSDAAIYEVRFYAHPDRIMPGPAKSVVLRALQDVLMQNELPLPVTQVELTKPPDLEFTLGAGEILDALRRVSLFHNALSNEDLEALAKRCKPSELPRGTILMSQGEAPASMFIILEGAASVSLVEPGREPHEVAISATGDVAGEMSLMTGAARSATVTALTRIRVLEITKDAIEDLLRRTPELLQRFSHVLAKRQAENQAASQSRAAIRAAEGDLLARMKSFFSRAFG